MNFFTPTPSAHTSRAPAPHFPHFPHFPHSSPYSLLPTPYSLFPTPDSRLPTP
ncbi:MULTISPECIES: hypothetical protein [unclassified Moorena]|uniref:hypothetical protein n=1 Tax=unclassified Moorena TaxID=2683338 RepID=UPI0013C918E1|nr:MULTISPECIES: hypothetical protein [unclassified Moorena]NEO23396.1 hypothetical protein [Moorena sp. SIO4A5]NEQ61911.1 hypothetical protein [Moorena sp. SIO4A1]